MYQKLNTDLGRRNLSPIQRIAIAEKYRPIYEKQAKEDISKAVTESNKNRANTNLVNLPNMEPNLVQSKADNIE